MRTVGLLALVGFGLVSMAVGLRLLRLWWRTREAPEFALGAGLLSIGALGFPISALGRAPGLVGTPLGDRSLALGLGLLCIGIGLVYAFNWKVFHPHAAWARACVGLGFLLACALATGVVVSPGDATRLEDILPRTRPWACGLVAVLALALAWSAVESLRHHRMQRRRLALGLADPVVANRFLLWGLSGAAAALLCAGIVASLLAGQVVLRDPMPLTLVAVVGSGASVCWSLTFFPPPHYLAWLRGAAEPPRAGGRRRA